MELMDFLPGGRMTEPAPKRRRRDSQRSKVYRAEDAAFGICSWSFPEPDSVEQTEQKARAILTSSAVRARYPKAPLSIRIEPGRGARKATAYYSHLVMPRWARSPRNWAVLFHELAHVIAQRTYGDVRHGWQFCEVYLFLVRELRGATEAEKLVAQFRAHGVRFKAPRKRTLSPEQREALRARGRALAATRLAARATTSQEV